MDLATSGDFWGQDQKADESRQFVRVSISKAIIRALLSDTTCSKQGAPRTIRHRETYLQLRKAGRWGIRHSPRPLGQVNDWFVPFFTSEDAIWKLTGSRRRSQHDQGRTVKHPASRQRHCRHSLVLFDSLNWCPLQTASTLTSAIYLLAITPNVLARLREEVLSFVGTSKKPTYDDIRDMKYLRAFINGEQLNFKVNYRNLHWSVSVIQKPWGSSRLCEYRPGVHYRFDGSYSNS